MIMFSKRKKAERLEIRGQELHKVSIFSSLPANLASVPDTTLPDWKLISTSSIFIIKNK